MLSLLSLFVLASTALAQDYAVFSRRSSQDGDISLASQPAANSYTTLPGSASIEGCKAACDAEAACYGYALRQNSNTLNDISCTLLGAGMATSGSYLLVGGANAIVGWRFGTAQACPAGCACALLLCTARSHVAARAILAFEAVASRALTAASPRQKANLAVPTHHLVSPSTPVYPAMRSSTLLSPTNPSKSSVYQPSSRTTVKYCASQRCARWTVLCSTCVTTCTGLYSLLLGLYNANLLYERDDRASDDRRQLRSE